MDKTALSTTERGAWHYWRFRHPHPRGQRNMDALYLQSQGLTPETIRGCPETDLGKK